MDDDTLAARCWVVADIDSAIHRIPALTFAGLVLKARLAYDIVPAPDPGQAVLVEVLAALLENIVRFVEPTQE